MTTTDDDARRDAFAQALDGLRFPATRDQALAWAQGGDAREEVLVDLRSLQDQEFGSWDELLVAVGIDDGGSVDVGTEPPGTRVGDPTAGVSANTSVPVRGPAGQAERDDVIREAAQEHELRQEQEKASRR